MGNNIARNVMGNDVTGNGVYRK